MPTRKELIASGVEITPLTREEILLQGGEIEPLNVKERVLQGVVGGGEEPTGTITITQNGTGIDVAQYATADVNVSAVPECAVLTINNSSSSAKTISVENSYVFTDNGFEIKGTPYTNISKGASKEFNLPYLTGVQPGTYGKGYMILSAQATNISVESSNCTTYVRTTWQSTYLTTNDTINAVIEVRGVKNNAVVSSPSMTILATT